MRNTSNLFCKGHPWQASTICTFLEYKDEMLMAMEASEIGQKPPEKLTEEAFYMIYVILTFIGLAVLGTSITAFESFSEYTEKKSESHENGCNKTIAKSTQRVSKERNPLSNYEFFEDCKSFLKCFCVLKNGSKILSTASTGSQIGCFQGLRFLSNVTIIGVHTLLTFLNVLRNVKEAKPVLDMRASHLAVNATFVVDIFFVIGGFLNAKSFFHTYSKANGNISWFNFYFKRYVRLTPVYMIVLGFYATLFSYTGSGIIWPTYNTNPLCQTDWWRHLLYINNFEDIDKQCMPWCWYLAADMQFYILSPLFMVPLIRWPRMGYALILAAISGSCIVSFVLTYQFNLVDGFSRFEFYLDDSKNFMIKYWKYFDVVYTKSYARISPYLVAILLAYFFYKKGFYQRTTRNSAMTLWCGWTVTALFTWICIFSLYKREEILMVTALYNGTTHLLFSCGLAWVIYLCLTGQSEFLNKYLSWKYFLPLSRLSYCAYLIHPLVMHKVLFEARDLMDFNIISMVLLYLYFLVFTYAVSFIASMLFEFPVLNILDWFSRKRVEKNSKRTHLD